MPTWSEDIVTAIANLGGVVRLGSIYEEVKRIRAQPHPPSLEAIVRGRIETHSSDSAAFRGQDLFFSVEGLGGGVWGLRSFITVTPEAADILDVDGNEVAPRTLQQIYRILRDATLARNIKLLYKNHCQIFGMSITLPNGSFYSEAHHIKPLGRPHDGPGIGSNLIVVCPNHHVMLDYGVIELRQSDVHMQSNHQLGQEFIDYHNEHIYGISSETRNT